MCIERVKNCGGSRKENPLSKWIWSDYFCDSNRVFFLIPTMFGIPFRLGDLDLPGPAADFYSVAAVLFAELFVRSSISKR
jgi:hypothetical protein